MRSTMGPNRDCNHKWRFAYRWPVEEEHGPHMGEYPVVLSCDLCHRRTRVFLMKAEDYRRRLTEEEKEQQI